MRLDWCSHEAAKYACENWHYSGCVPKSKLAKVGVWEDGRFLGAVIYGVGATQNIGSPYGLFSHECCELVRVALRRHRTPVSRILAVAQKLLRGAFPGLRLIVSYADSGQGHHGGIYQACGWFYVGRTGTREEIQGKDGVWRHGRSHRHKYQTETGYPKRKTQPKHKYLMPLDDAMRAKVAPLARPYPKRAGSADSGTSPDQGGGGGATPTPALPPHCKQ